MAKKNEPKKNEKKKQLTSIPMTIAGLTGGGDLSEITKSVNSGLLDRKDPKPEEEKPSTPQRKFRSMWVSKFFILLSCVFKIYQHLLVKHNPLAPLRHQHFAIRLSPLPMPVSLHHFRVVFNEFFIFF